MSDPETEPTREFEDEEVAFRKDGTVIVRFDGTRYVLKRPKFKELRVIREQAQLLDRDRAGLLDPFDEQIRELVGGLQDKIDALQAANVGQLTAADVLASGGTTEELRAAKTYDQQLRAQLDPFTDELRDLQRSDGYKTLVSARREASDQATEMGLTYFLDMILKQLATPTPNGLEAGDLPTWAGSVQFISDLYDHWSSVPRRPGIA